MALIRMGPAGFSAAVAPGEGSALEEAPGDNGWPGLPVALCKAGLVSSCDCFHLSFEFTTCSPHISPTQWASYPSPQPNSPVSVAQQHRAMGREVGT